MTGLGPFPVLSAPAAHQRLIPLWCFHGGIGTFAREAEMTFSLWWPVDP